MINKTSCSATWSTEPESYTAIMLFFLSSSDGLVYEWIFHDGFCIKQQQLTPSSQDPNAFDNFKVTRGAWCQSVRNNSFICNTIFFTFVHVHKELSNETYSLLMITEVEIQSVCWRQKELVLSIHVDSLLWQMSGSVILWPIFHTSTEEVCEDRHFAALW